MLSKDKGARYECPFDNQGYCHRHSHVRLAKKKLTGGWKILNDFCVECVQEVDHDDDNRSVCSRSSRMSRKSVSSRCSRRSASSKSGRSRRSSYEGDETNSEYSASQSERKKKKKVVKKMAYTDDNNEQGLYTGYINSQYKPHGSGKMVYNDGRRFSGEWCDGSKVHGKMTTTRSSSGEKSKKRDKHGKGEIRKEKNTTSSNGSVKASIPNNEITEKQKKHEQKQTALKDYKNLYNNAATVVKNMVFVDFFGDRGRYTGEVNGDKIPHGKGEITYDHGLVQEGNWVSSSMYKML